MGTSYDIWSKDKTQITVDGKIFVEDSAVKELWDKYEATLQAYTALAEINEGNLKSSIRNGKLALSLLNRNKAIDNAFWYSRVNKIKDWLMKWIPFMYPGNEAIDRDFLKLFDKFIKDIDTYNYGESEDNTRD